MQQNIANTATGVAATSGVWVFMSDNAPVLGLMLTFVSICIATAFYYANYRLAMIRLRIAMDDSKNGVPQKFTDCEMDAIKRAIKNRRKNAPKDQG